MFSGLFSIKTMTKLYKLLVLVVLLGSCQENTTTEKRVITRQTDSSLLETKENTITPQTQNNPYKEALIEVKIISSVENTFGYEIWIEGQKTIHQPTIPSVAGNKGFKSKEQAQKVADFVVSKIRNNQMPPSISPKELDSLGVLK
jgi:hypothetical protein